MTFGNTQESITQKDALFLLGRAHDGYVKLRWAPNNFALWQTCMKEGVVLERFSMKRGGTLLSVTERSTIFSPRWRTITSRTR